MAVELRAAVAGEGPPVVLLHAFPLNADMWFGQRDGLADGCRLVVPDLRGFGGSPLDNEPPSLDRSADDVAALLDRLAIDKAVVGGISMGGYIIMALLRRHPGRVRAVVLADTKAGADPEPAKANRERIASTILAERGPRVLLDDVLPSLLGETTMRTRPEVVARVRALVEAAPPEAVAWAQRAMAARADSFDTLRTAAVPALVVVGDEDPLAPPSEAEAMVAALREGGAPVQSHVVPGAGHLTAVEAPGEFNGLVGEFLDWIT